MSLSSLATASQEIASLWEANRSFSETTRQLMIFLKGVVPCDSINLGTVDLDTEEGFHFALDGFLMPTCRRQLLSQFKHQHPMLEVARKGGLNPPLRFTDFCSRRQFEESPLYRECYRGYTHSMLTFGVAAVPGVNVSFVLSRGSEDFKEEDCEKLNVLQPLIASLLRQRILADALQLTRLHGQPIGVAYGSGQNLHVMDAHTRQLLHVHYPIHSKHRLPDQLWNEIAPQFGQLVTARSLPQGGRLCARIGPDVHGWRLELWEDENAISPKKLARFGLTHRQAEVLQWLIAGKGNLEIALILGISARTVEKHIESVYRQLGVENRLAAIRRCQSEVG